MIIYSLNGFQEIYNKIFYRQKNKNIDIEFLKKLSALLKFNGY